MLIYQRQQRLDSKPRILEHQKDPFRIIQLRLLTFRWGNRISGSRRNDVSQPDKEEKGKYIADFLCAGHQGKPLAHILSSNPPRNPMPHVPSFPSFSGLKVQNDHTAEQGKSRGQSQAAPFHSPWLLSTRQSCAYLLFNIMKLLRPRVLKQPCGVGIHIPLEQIGICE